MLFRGKITNGLNFKMQLVRLFVDQEAQIQIQDMNTTRNGQGNTPYFKYLGHDTTIARLLKYRSCSYQNKIQSKWIDAFICLKDLA